MTYGHKIYSTIVTVTSNILWLYTTINYAGLCMWIPSLWIHWCCGVQPQWNVLGSFMKQKITILQSLKNKKYIFWKNYIFLFEEGINLCIDRHIMLKVWYMTSNSKKIHDVHLNNIVNCILIYNQNIYFGKIIFFYLRKKLIYV